ncbi:hypothetical protein L7F22_036234 [Adiantum nelumboides]|nr:hypothetical protein [Adiantum nelumboides]
MFHFQIVHVEGKKNVVADALSHKPLVFAVSISYHNELEEMKGKYAEDEHFARIYEQMVNEQRHEHYTLMSDFLMMHGKLCVTKQLRPKVLIECHAPPYVAHCVVYATVKAVDTFFYWPTLRRDVDAFVRSCLVCQMVMLKCYVSEHKTIWEHSPPWLSMLTITLCILQQARRYLEGGKKVPPVLQTKDKIFEADKYVQNTVEAYRKVKIALEKTQSKQKKAADCHRHELVFSLGDWVLLRFEKELFEGYYFCQAQRGDYFSRAKPRMGHPTIVRMQKLAKELDMVIPVSFFEEANNAHYNSIVVIDADGTDLGLYRKSHIPDGPGYQEKFYFNPGDTGFKVFPTKFAKIGVAICWDQWFPEAARAMALMGAEILFYPTAIGSEPQDPGLYSCEHWRRVMQGHAGANVVPLVASNRVGREIIETEHGPSEITFYGCSFITGPTGELVAKADDESEAVLIAKFDLNKIREQRHTWGVFRDRRPHLYSVLLTSDGHVPSSNGYAC